LALAPNDPILRALAEKLKKDQLAWEQEKQRAATRIQQQQDRNTAGALILAGFAVVAAQLPRTALEDAADEMMRDLIAERPCRTIAGWPC
jgi:hypothetical protein